MTMFLNLFGLNQNIILHQTFTNAVELILSVIAFKYYLDQKNRFTASTAKLTATITISFMMRNTSPIGWIPLLAIKVLKEGAFVPFLLAGIFVAVPLIGAIIAVDTWFYTGKLDGSEWVVTSYNFYRMNIEIGGSESFGYEPFEAYVGSYICQLYPALWPFVYIGVFTHVCTKFQTNSSPYLSYFSLFYVAFFSFIGHKELRFMLPIVGFSFVFAAELMVQMIKRGGWKRFVASFATKAFILVEPG